MGRSSRIKRERRRAGGMQRVHDAGELRCDNCRRAISPNEVSFSCGMPWGLVVSCYGCAPGLMQVFDQLFETGTQFQECWLHHCAGDGNAFDDLRME